MSCIRTMDGPIFRRSLSQLLCFGLILAIPTLAASSDLHGQGTPEPLQILLTNDDGFDAPGITAMHEALMAAGHDVIVVAPAENQSGSSARRRSSGVFHYLEAEPGVWHVDGSPADAVLMALNVILGDFSPDLVVSGINFGQNIGTSTSHSGTVGAAITATRNGVPSIAVSAAITPEGAAARPPYPGTRQAFPAAASLIVDLIEDLRESRADDGAILPPDIMLNVNHPAVAAGEVRGVRFAPVSNVSAYRRSLSPTGEPGEVEASLSALGVEELPEGSDVRLLAQGYVVVNVIDARGDGGPSAREAIEDRVSVGP